MKPHLNLALILGLLILLGCEKPKPESQRPPEIPMEEFFKNPESYRFRLSPDGTSLSFLTTYNKRLNIHVKDLATGDTIRVTSDTARDIRMYAWANNNQLIYFQDTGGDENFQLFAADKTGDNVTALTNFEGVRTQLIDDLPDLPQEIIIEMNKENPQVFDPYRINIVTGELTKLAANPGDITEWFTDHEGKLRLAIKTDGVNQTFLYRPTEEDEFEEIMSITFKDTFAPMFFTFDNKNLYALSNLGRNTTAVVEFDLETKTEKALLYENPDYDVTDLSYSRKRKVLSNAMFEADRVGYYFFDDQTKKMYEAINNGIEGDLDIYVLASTKAEDKFMFVTESDRTGTIYYTYDMADEQIELVANTRPWINPENMASVKPIQYQSRDGLTINGYLTLPTGIEPKNLPVVVHPHGGPWARDSWGYNPELQFLANRGYAVLQMNFRGSTGYGKEFWMKSFKQWGRTMQNDITDGTKYLIDQGIADPERIAIYGGSYGGYATLAGVTLTPDLYAAGIDYVGVSNMFTFMNTIPPYWEPFRDMFYEMVGDPTDAQDSVMLREVSPVFLADSIKVPMLIAQGAKDPRVNIAESDQIVEALKDNMVEVDYIVKENEGHGFSNEENRFEFYQAMETFLDKHIGEKMEIDKSEM
ncbi:S9 family peptidase [Reichenbachiella ulvae]|uniref:S9 family peptidase n=1 Tax=Reichenbachiella ulvae TaxID=2980104 RepID=A0ABT3CTQ9_9BACT|nr:S9 family peptidase [Reichenbachiella ulvae]MCV9387017.1 S9 family peptidase [Reichenbachiella ulvae]